MPGAAVVPFWGAQTSYLNFCEEDYAVTRYIAELINTLSSLTFVAYGVYGLSRVRWRDQTSSRLVSYCGLIGVGVCSAGYHMTLKYHTQMSDELSMHLLTTPLLYRLLTFKASPERTRLVGVILLVLFTVVMVTHMMLDEFLLHASSFGLAVYLIATRVAKIIPQQVSDPRIRRKLKNMASFGCLSFVFGYFVWLIDEWACSVLTSIRQSIGLPLAFCLELHGWWHIFTAIGGYVAVVLVDTVTTGEVREDPTRLLAWPIPFAANFMSGASEADKRK